jgi:glycosyltransferase involved in cell wall biosynthesis
MVDQLQLRRHVHLLGFVTGESKASLYQAVDCLVLPSAHESFGYSALEALACGTTVLTTKAVNIWQELESSGGAKVVDQTPSALGAAMTSLQADLSQGAHMGALGRAWILTTLDAVHVLNIYEQIFRSMTSAHQAS